MLGSLDQFRVDKEEEVGDAQEREENQSGLDSFTNLQERKSVKVKKSVFGD